MAMTGVMAFMGNGPRSALNPFHPHNGIYTRTGRGGMDAAIRLEGVTKQFSWAGKRFKAVDSVSLEICKGEIFGLLGPNGAGKTTLINILSTLLVPDSGRVEILGLDALARPREVVGRMNFVSGTTNFHRKETVESLLSFYAEVYGLPDPSSKIDSLTEELGIQHLLGHEYSRLSTGEQSRVHIAKALLNDPELLMLDEPTLGLDPSISVKVRSMLKEVNKKRGTTILLTSHYMHDVEELCDRVGFINHGRILAVGTVDELLRAASPDLTLRVELEELPAKSWFSKEGFSVDAGLLVKKIPSERVVPSLIKKLVDKGLMVTTVHVERPSLEEYFISMTKGGGVR